jgi:hypothetical protein
MNASTVKTRIAIKTIRSTARYFKGKSIMSRKIKIQKFPTKETENRTWQVKDTIQRSATLLLHAPRNPIMDIKKMKPPRAITGNVSDLLQPSLCVLIHTPNIITATANSFTKSSNTHKLL